MNLKFLFIKLLSHISLFATEHKNKVTNTICSNNNSLNSLTSVAEKASKRYNLFINRNYRFTLFNRNKKLLLVQGW